MSRPRKRHVQQELFRHGGKRAGAGRKPKGERAGAPHKARPVLKPWQPVHIVLRVNREVGGLRKRHMYRALRAATIAVARRELHWDPENAFRIVHLSIQQTHVHLLVEAAHERALSRGMQSFQISAAKHINRAYSERSELARRRRGNVFEDRYHEEIITSPRQARHALAYVLNNWRKHREDRVREARGWNVDPFSSGVLFGGWSEREDKELMWRWRDTYDPLFVYLPDTWLLQTGWRQHGLISFHEVPGSRRRTSPKRRGSAGRVSVPATSR